MRVYSLVLYLTAFGSFCAKGQVEYPTKIRFYSSDTISLITTLDLNHPIQVSGITVLEMASDSLGIRISQDRIIPFFFAPLEDYTYFLDVSPKGKVSISPMKRYGFWPRSSDLAKTYRRYYWDKKTGLNLREVAERN